MKTTAPRIAIISYSTQLRYAAYINHQVYARLHGYDYIFDLAVEDEPNPYYAKLHKIRKFIGLYDYVLWVDDDAFFTQLQQPLAEALPMKAHLTIANSPRYSDTQWTAVNSGVMLLKNSLKTRQFLDDCLQQDRAAVKAGWDAATYGLYTGGEQDVITHLLYTDSRYKRRFAQIVDYQVCNARPADYTKKASQYFIVHFAGVPERDTAIDKFATRFGLTPALLPKKYAKLEHSYHFATADTAKLLRLQHKRHLLERKYDAQSKLLAQIFARPVQFAAQRLYHYYLKRDQTNAPQD